MSANGSMYVRSRQEGRNVAVSILEMQQMVLGGAVRGATNAQAPIADKIRSPTQTSNLGLFFHISSPPCSRPVLL